MHGFGVSKICQFGKFIQSLLQRSFLPFVADVHVIHRHAVIHSPLHEKPGGVKAEIVIFDILMPQRRICVGIHKQDMHGYSRIIFLRLLLQPEITFAGCGILGAFQRFVELMESGIFAVMSFVLPTDEIDDFRQSPAQIVKTFDDIKRVGKCKTNI